MDNEKCQCQTNSKFIGMLQWCALLWWWLAIIGPTVVAKWLCVFHAQDPKVILRPGQGYNFAALYMFFVALCVCIVANFIPCPCCLWRWVGWGMQILRPPFFFFFINSVCCGYIPTSRYNEHLLHLHCLDEDAKSMQDH